MKYSEVLKEAKELLKDPNNWNKDGLYYKINDQDSGCYCIFGAINQVTGNYYPEADEFYFEAKFNTSSDPVIDFNDDPETTHEDLMDWFDKMIDQVEGTENDLP